MKESFSTWIKGSSTKVVQESVEIHKFPNVETMDKIVRTRQIVTVGVDLKDIKKGIDENNPGYGSLDRYPDSEWKTLISNSADGFTADVQKNVKRNLVRVINSDVSRSQAPFITYYKLPKPFYKFKLGDKVTLTDFAYKNPVDPSVNDIGPNEIGKIVGSFGAGSKPNGPGSRPMYAVRFSLRAYYFDENELVKV